MTPAVRPPFAVAAAALLLAGCASPGTSSSPSGTVNVFAAASLREAFTELAPAFEAAHPGTTVVFNFGPSSGLATQITQGAPADVFASASAKNMTQVVDAGFASAPTVFAKNVLQIAVPTGNPAKITGISDLARSGVKVALCQVDVPCGALAEDIFTRAGVHLTPVTQEVDVKAVLTKVTLGEVDAGLVYVTDVKAAGPKVTGVTIPDAQNASTSYPIAALSKSANSAGAQAFTAYVVSSDGLAALSRAGFAKP
jgi:molybdate transport system substrate-binding protein